MKSSYVLMALTVTLLSGCAAPTKEDAAKNQNHIIEYDGIPLDTKRQDIVKLLEGVKGVNRSSDGKVIFERVPARPYYRYHINRKYCDSKGKKAQSEVALLFKRGKLIQIRDVFGGWYKTEAETQRFIKPILDDLEKQWGSPNSRTKETVTWIRDGITAELITELPDNQYGLPVVKLHIYE